MSEIHYQHVLSKLKLPPVVLWPLFVGSPCVIWPRGRRVGDPKPARMSSRGNHEFIEVLEERAGENWLHQNVRHVDDPALAKVLQTASIQTPGWDYCEGLRYDFLVPAKVLHLESVEPIDLHLAQVIINLANPPHRKNPTEIASMLAIPKVNANLIRQLLMCQLGNQSLEQTPKQAAA